MSTSGGRDRKGPTNEYGAPVNPAKGQDEPWPGRRQLTEELPLQRQKTDVVSRMESAYGASFSDVNLRTDDEAGARASSMNARAYTDGREIGFAPGVFNPDTREGLHTIAHEFAHVVQRRGGSGGGIADTSGAIGVPGVQMDPTDASQKSGNPLEANADAAASAVVDGKKPTGLLHGDFDWAMEGPKPKLIEKGKVETRIQDNGINFYFNPEDAPTWADFNHAWNQYFIHVWPTANADVVKEAKNSLQAQWVVPPPPVDKLDKTRNVVVRITAQYHQFTCNWMAKHHPDIKPKIPPAVQPPSDGKGDGSTAYSGEKFVPKATLVIHPQLEPTQQYVKGAKINARVLFDKDPQNYVINVFPNIASFDWTIWKGEKVYDKGPLIEGRGDIEYDLALKEEGQFQVTCQVTSHRFISELPPLSSPLLTVVDQYTRAEQDKNTLLVDGKEDKPEVKALKPFTMDEWGNPQFKKGQTGTSSLDEQLLRLSIMETQLKKAFEDGRITPKQKEEFDAALATYKANYEEERKRLVGSKSFACRGVFTNREDSSAIPLVVTLRQITAVESDSKITLSLELVDMTIDPSNRMVLTATGSVNVADYADSGTAIDDAARRAVNQLAIEFHDHNEYPDGIVTIIAQLPSGASHTAYCDTYRKGKTVKKIAGGVALGAAVIGIGAAAVALAPESGGTSLVAGAKAVGAVATAVGIIVGVPLTIESINEHMKYRRGAGADRQITMDMLALVSMGLGGGTFSNAFRNLGKVGTAMYLGTMAGSDIAQGVLIRDDYLNKITMLEMQYTAAVNSPDLTPDQKADLKRQHQQATAQVLAEAAMQGGFLLVSLAGTAHGFVEIKYKGKPVNVRGEIAEIVKTKDWKLAREHLNDTGTLKTNEEIKVLEDVFDQHAPASEKTGKTGAGGTEVKPPEVKPSETKPSETKPPEVKPAETKPPETTPETKPPDATTKEGMIDALAGKKALAEQHAHADGSVPVESVLAEKPETSATQRAKQIDDLRGILDEVGKELVELADLRSGKTKVDGQVVTPQEKVALAKTEAAVEGERGLLNKLFKAKMALNEAVNSGAPADKQAALRANVNALLIEYHQHLTMRKPDYARYAEDVNTGAEFFRRYKMITGHNLTPREIASTRASAGELASQELRVGLKGEADDIAQLKDLSKEFNEANAAAQAKGDKTDVSLIVNTTKKKSGDPAHAEQVASMVDEWGKGGDLQKAVSGFDNAGVENPKLPPKKLWKAHAKTAFMNAKAVQGEIKGNLAPEQRGKFLEALTRVLGGDADGAAKMLEAFEKANFDAALADVNARGAGEEVASTNDGTVTDKFGGMTMEDAAVQTRKMMDALRSHRAEVGDPRALPAQLGTTVHAGEQLKGLNPFTLLEQVEQAISLGADRIGHGLILGIDPEVLVAIRKAHKAKPGTPPEALPGLAPSQVAEFAARQKAVREHAKKAGVTIEMNITSNTEISNLTNKEHPGADMVKDGLKVSVSTDDETVLATTVKAELQRLAAADGITRTDMAKVILEGFYSRMGARELKDRARLKADFHATLTQGLSAPDLDALARALAQRFCVSITEGDPNATIRRVLDTVFGVGG